MRHSRSRQFEAAFARLRAQPRPARWTDVTHDPNDPLAVSARAQVLRAAWRAPMGDRLTFLESRCRGRRVLDIGCVAHDAARMQSPEWVHRRLAAVAAECVGVDVVEDGVMAMTAAGFRAVAHDLTTGLGPVSAHAPFDVIVAGELIEHVEDVGMLFRTAAAALAPEGELIITTPNPYAPARVRAARQGVVWENVDHIVYAFPSGVAELCERHGLVLAEAMTIVPARTRRPVASRLRRLYGRLRGTQWADVGVSTAGSVRTRLVSSGWLRTALAHRWCRATSGETFVYVVRRGPLR